MTAVIVIGFATGARAQYNCVPVGPKDLVTGVTPMHCDGVPAASFYCVFSYGPGAGAGCTGAIPTDLCGNALASSFQQCGFATDPICYQMAYNQWNNCRQLTGGAR
jgi:hypothetical protein